MTIPENWIDQVLTFWFDELSAADWFVRKNEVDTQIRDRFLALHEELSVTAAAVPPLTGRHALATVIVLDQFPRNMFRGSSRAFETDALALLLAGQAIDAHLDRELTPQQRMFLYMPYQHAEDPAVQARSLELFASLGVGHGEALNYARQHKDVIDRFGRFPHRNDVLGRESTPEERVFLKTHPGF